MACGESIAEPRGRLGIADFIGEYALLELTWAPDGGSPIDLKAAGSRYELELLINGRGRGHLLIPAEAVGGDFTNEVALSPTWGFNPISERVSIFQAGVEGVPPPVTFQNTYTVERTGASITLRSEGNARIRTQLAGPVEEGAVIVRVLKTR